VETGSHPLGQLGGPPAPKNCGQVAKHAEQAAGRTTRTPPTISLPQGTGVPWTVTIGTTPKSWAARTWAVRARCGLLLS
jgi:hypothetical protein